MPVTGSRKVTTGESPQPTVEQQAHVAAAAYLMKHTGTTALMVLDPDAGQPAGIITEADIARAVADGKDGSGP
jgi:CBS domain-containing protein